MSKLMIAKDNIYFQLSNVNSNNSTIKFNKQSNEQVLDDETMNWKEFINESDGCQFIKLKYNKHDYQNNLAVISTLEEDRPNPADKSHSNTRASTILPNTLYYAPGSNPTAINRAKTKESNRLSYCNSFYNSKEISENENSNDIVYSFEANRRMKRISMISTNSCPENNTSRVINNTCKLSRSSSFASSKSGITEAGASIGLLENKYNKQTNDKNNPTRLKSIIKKGFIKPIFKSFQKESNRSGIIKRDDSNSSKKERQMAEELSLMELAIDNDNNQRSRLREQRYGNEKLHSFKSIPYLKSSIE
ncbi:hypothetical protein K502DRAFT_322673 [Neoconidiobolus thromboides FSU 785]|nr:hypothetical protein K502DRAFT_322673 [Neoconidiobolus thromboides FSU 785]